MIVYFKVQFGPGFYKRLATAKNFLIDKGYEMFPFKTTAENPQLCISLMIDLTSKIALTMSEAEFTVVTRSDSDSPSVSKRILIDKLDKMENIEKKYRGSILASKLGLDGE